MKNQKNISILNKIQFKPTIMETVYPFILKRVTILDSIISNDDLLKNKINNLFANTSKNNNLEYCKNFKNYSDIRNIKNKLNEWLNKIKSKPITFGLVKSQLNFSFIKYLYNSLLNDNNNNFNKEILKSVTLEYYSSLDKATVIFLQNKKNDFDIEYINLIEKYNDHSKEKNKIKQKIKLILIIENIDNNYLFKEIKYPNINELELMFSDKKLSKGQLFTYFNKYLSEIKHLENIKRIILNNKTYNNYLNDLEDGKEISNDLYQSLVSFMFDEYYSEKSDIKYQVKLLQNVKEIFIENIEFLYIYEKIKLYYCINDIFPLLNKNNNLVSKNEFNIQYYINNKIMIINNKDTPITIKNIISFVNRSLNKNKNIQYLFILNKNIIINDIDDGNEKEINDIKVDISNLKEFMFISEQSEYNIRLIDILTKDNEKEKNIYKGYDKDNKLIFYRKGYTFIQSFDLIDLFKYNQKLTHIELKNEQVIINYNEERTKLEIININPVKSEFNDGIINIGNYLSINHITQFIYNQNNLIELTIHKFDFSFNDIINKNIKILNINYEEDISILKYKIKDEKSKDRIIKLFPNLTNLNIGTKELSWVLNLQIKDIPDVLKNIKILTIFQKNNKISKIQKKFKKCGKEIIFEFIDKEVQTLDDNDDDDGEGDNINVEYDEFDTPVNNKYKYGIYSKTILTEQKGRGKYIVEKFDPSWLRYSVVDNYYWDKNFKDNIDFFSLNDYSKILKEYNNISKKFQKNYYILKSKVMNLKLLYRASEQKKFKVKDIFKFEDILSKNNYILIIKMDNELYLYMEPNKSPYNPYNSGEFFLLNSGYGYNPRINSLIFNKDEGFIEIKDALILNDVSGYGHGYITYPYEMHFRNKIIAKKSPFNVLDLEIFQKI